MIRWGVIGPGGIASRFAEAMAYVDDGEIVAVSSRSAERAAAFADRYGIAGRYGDVAALLADPSVDAVYVATPHSRHEVDTIASLEAGKHVLCEKPFALNEAQGRRMVEAARRRDRFLMEAVWSRFLPSYRSLVEVLTEGRIGRPLLVEADFGFRVPLRPEHRLFDPGLGGGALLDLGIYPLQLCSLVLGRVESVVAEAVVGETGVDEQVAAVLRYEGGALGVIKAATRVGLACTARVSGSDGWIDIPAFMHHPDSITVHTASGSERIDAGFDGDGLQFEIVEAQRCIEAGAAESATMPLADTLALAATMDTIRAQIGVAYPGE